MSRLFVVCLLVRLFQDCASSFTFVRFQKIDLPKTKEEEKLPPPTKYTHKYTDQILTPLSFVLQITQRVLLVVHEPAYFKDNLRTFEYPIDVEL